jgi:prepilin-type N-terminal cleavage/methylation domain-containing protein
MIVRRTAARAAVRRAFTLLEILVVVAIIVILAGVGVYALMPQLDQAKERSPRPRPKGWPGPPDLQDQQRRLPGEPGHAGDAAAQRAPPLIPAEKLLDPWGQPYGYNPAGRTTKASSPMSGPTAPTAGRSATGRWRSEFACSSAACGNAKPQAAEERWEVFMPRRTAHTPCWSCCSSWRSSSS